MNDIYLITNDEMEQLVFNLKGVLFLNKDEKLLFEKIKSMLSLSNHDSNALNDRLHQDLKSIQEKLNQDLAFFVKKDPAAISTNYVLSTYISFDAVMIYRFANLFITYNYLTFARKLSEYAHHATGIDIHPAASIGVPFFIDHGTGIVIGETTIIKDHVSIYQGVTLGAKSLDDASSLRGIKRHPTIDSYAVLYANVTVLGGDVEIGENAIIGASSFITKSVEKNSIISFKK
jgi:serine O-acetyltransferase